ncbi:hypothetical protein HDU80_004793 [Chytriomyces hyalinus]|nr:hypothetical protein HDU80_004793 [Chytriomyces hyalinus]
MIAPILLALSATASARPLPLPQPQPLPQPHNCLSDVIHARGLEKIEMERRWHYDGGEGVMNWGHFNATCEAGEHQSPVDFEGEGLAISGKPDLTWSDLTTPFNFTNNGHTVQLNLGQSTPKLVTRELDGREYTVAQCHFHSPSEHHLDQKYFDLEAHFVHASADGKLNVIGIFFDLGDKDNIWLDQFIDNLPAKENATTQVPKLNMAPIISHLQNTSYFSYSGSLTTPPCSEGVLWMVAREPMDISPRQLKKLRTVMPFNSRPVQPNIAVDGPEVFEDDAETTSSVKVTKSEDGASKHTASPVSTETASASTDFSNAAVSLAAENNKTTASVDTSNLVKSKASSIQLSWWQLVAVIAVLVW